MSARISVSPLDGDVFEVTVQDATTTTHRVTVTDADLHACGATDKAELLHASFEFLLAREPNTMIYAQFELPVINRYFPTYPAEMKKRFGA